MIVLRMVEGGVCQGCGSHERVDRRLRLCGACAGLAIAVHDRKRKLDGTIRGRFARKMLEVKAKLVQFNSMGRTI